MKLWVAEGDWSWKDVGVEVGMAYHDQFHEQTHHKERGEGLALPKNAQEYFKGVEEATGIPLHKLVDLCERTKRDANLKSFLDVSFCGCEGGGLYRFESKDMVYMLYGEFNHERGMMGSVFPFPPGMLWGFNMSGFGWIDNLRHTFGIKEYARMHGLACSWSNPLSFQDEVAIALRPVPQRSTAKPYTFVSPETLVQREHPPTEEGDLWVWVDAKKRHVTLGRAYGEERVYTLGG